MAIDLTGLSSVNAGTRSKASTNVASARSGAAEKQPAAAQTQPETVKLSSEAQMLNKLEEQVAQLPDTDESRIASIKQAVEDGSYSIDPERIASKLTSLEDQLFG
ncbi:MAG: flagellar biosynthesis anti-sigma factor FlgM [Halopseudomonas sp.]